ncbi:phosphatidylinositol phosphate synthase [Demequina sp.]|uniref:phosphatidylinositol phosphate synthase n=1 Tax=Demequina sp. TaxID=2050685 RepID=UPI003D0D366B
MGAIWKAPARGLLALGVHPNVMTLVGTAGVMFGALFFFPKYGDNEMALFWGVMVITFFVLTDMLDGTMARLGNKSSRLGAFLDSTMDRVADAAIFGALVFAFMDENRLTATAALVCLVVGGLVPYSRARAESIGVDAKGGLAERSDRLVIGLVATGLVGLGLPLAVLTWTLWVLALLGTITVVQRIFKVVSAARRDPEWNKDLDRPVEREPHA